MSSEEKTEIKNLAMKFSEHTEKGFSIEPIVEEPTVKYALMDNHGKAVCYAANVEDLATVKKAFVAASMLAGITLMSMVDKKLDDMKKAEAEKPEEVTHGV